MKITNCNCGNLIDCGCELSFDSYVSPSLSVLSVGNLIGGTCTLQEYVIDWYRNGVRELVSGVGTDPEIEAYHPFLGTASIPVLPGNWVPVVRYIVVNGVQIFNEKKNCKDWCLWISNLPTVIVVNPINCASTSYPVGNYYDYRIAYVSSQDYSLSSRKIMYMLKDDLTIKYVAFAFHGYTVADRIDIYHNNDTIPVTSVIVGTIGISGNQYTTMPYVFLSGAGPAKFLIDVNGYSVGDYLRIEITPSVLENNFNTNWTLDIKCLDASYLFPSEFFTTAMQTITGLNLVNDIANCRYVLEVTVQEVLNFSISYSPLANWYKYLSLTSVGIGNGGSPTVVGNTYKVYQIRGTSAGLDGYTIPGSGVQLSLVNDISIVKTGNITVITCPTDEDYNAYYNSYNTMMASAWGGRYSSDSSNPNYYRRFLSTIRITNISCGDAAVTIAFNMHPSVIPVFDPVLRTITITTQLITNDLIEEPCNGSYSEAQTIVDGCNGYHNLADFSYLTKCRDVGPFGYGLGIKPTTITNTSYPIGRYYALPLPINLPNELDLFCYDLADFYRPYKFLNYYVEFKLIALPHEENYEVYSRVSADGCYTNTNQRLLYKVENNVVTVNNLPSI